MHRQNGEVTLPFGRVAGRVTTLGAEFLGIPFAVPPNRFEPPEPWTANFTGGLLNATSFTAQCPQPHNPPHEHHKDLPASPPPLMSEDCLHLNVYVPRRAAEDVGLLPVLVWIHGGSLITGSAMMPVYNASHLAVEQRAVVVAMNYRLNVLGFSPVAESGGRVVANNGFKDQQEALRWVQRHVTAFGGNASHVTIFGESAGGQSVAVQLVSPFSSGLFHAAICESGDVTSVNSLSTALNFTATLSKNVSCGTSLACLKAANVTALVHAFSVLSKNATNGNCGAVVDGELLPASPVQMVQRGSFHRVPFLFGSNAQEGSRFIADSTFTAKQARCTVEQAVGPNKSAAVLALYPTTPGSDNRDVLVSITTDAMFSCPARKLASAIAATGTPTWGYEFRRHPSCAGFGAVPGAAHGYEIPYVFDDIADLVAQENAWLSAHFPRRGKPCVLAAEDVDLATTVSSLWGTFGRQLTFQSNVWPLFVPPKEVVVKLDVGSVTSALDTDSGYRRRQCQAMEQLSFGFTDAINMLTSQHRCM